MHRRALLAAGLVLAPARSAAPGPEARPGASGSRSGPAAPSPPAPPHFESAHAVAGALYAALDRRDFAAALACFEEGEDVVAVGPGVDAVAVGRRALEGRAAKVLELGAPVGAITRARIRAGATAIGGGVFLDDIEVPGEPPLRVQMLVLRSGRDPTSWRVRLFHAAATLPDEEAAAAARAGRYPLGAWPFLPAARTTPEPIDRALRAWHQALADRDLAAYMALFSSPDLQGAGSAPHERATSADAYAAQIRPLLVGADGRPKPRRAAPPADSVGFLRGTVAWAFDAYTLDLAEAGRTRLPVRVTVVMEAEVPSGWRIRSLFASVPRPSPVAPTATGAAHGGSAP